MYRTDFWTLGEGEGGMFQENNIKTCILSRVKQITSPGWMHETSAWAWCTGKTHRDRGGGRWEGGSGWEIYVNPWLIHVNVWQKPLQYCKVIIHQLIKIYGKIIITLNVNGLNAPTKRQRLAEYIQKQTPIYAVYKRPTSKQGKHTNWKWRAGKKIIHATGDQKKAGVAILISDKIDFKIKAVKRDKEGHYIMIKGSIQEEDITIINIYTPNIGALQYVRKC